MDRAELDDLTRELFDSDLPNVTLATLGSGGEFYGSFSREYLETEEIAGARSVFLAAKADVENVVEGDSIEIDDETYFIRVIEPSGRGISALLLGK